MKKLIIFIMVIFFITGCNSTKDSSNATNYDPLAFQKKQECLTLKTDIEEEIKKRTIDSNNSEFNMSNSVYVGELKRIFYSSKLDSCLYIWEKTSEDKSLLSETITTSYILYDYLNDKELAYFTGCRSIKGDGCYLFDPMKIAKEQFEEEIKKYEL